MGKDWIRVLKLFVQKLPKMKKYYKKLRDLNARREHDAGDDDGDEEQEPVHHTRGRGVLQHQKHDLDPGSGAFLTPPNPGWVNNQDPEIRDEQPGSYFRQLRNNFLG